MLKEALKISVFDQKAGAKFSIKDTINNAPKPPKINLNEDKQELQKEIEKLNKLGAAPGGAKRKSQLAPLNGKKQLPPVKIGGKSKNKNIIIDNGQGELVMSLLTDNTQGILKRPQDLSSHAGGLNLNLMQARAQDSTEDLGFTPKPDPPKENPEDPSKSKFSP